MKTLILYNPDANEGKAYEILDRERARLNKIGSQYDMRAIQDIQEFLSQEKPDVIAVAGGDGSVNKVASFVLKLQQKPFMAIIPLGFGNAISYALGVETFDKALDVLETKPATKLIDVMKTSSTITPFALFNISLGFDARIVHNRMNFKYIGIRSYALSVIRGILGHSEKEMTITIDNRVTLQATASSLVIANIPIIGRNFIVSPRARFDDGLLDCTLFSTKYAYLTNLRLRGFKYPFYSSKGKVYFKAKNIHVEGEPYYQIDGDPGMSQKGFSISVLPKKLKFLCNTKENIDQEISSFV